MNPGLSAVAPPQLVRDAARIASTHRALSVAAGEADALLRRIQKACQCDEQPLLLHTWMAPHPYEIRDVGAAFEFRVRWTNRAAS
jgi:hypothetical protein